jgi:hypothetical protein
VVVKGPTAVLYDEVDDVLVVRFSDEPYGWAVGLDAERRVFYARDGSALAVVVEGASRAVAAADLPHVEVVRLHLRALRRPRRRGPSRAA